MSVRTERNIDSASDGTADLSQLSTAMVGLDVDHVNATISAAQTADSALGGANSISTNHPGM